MFGAVVLKLVGMTESSDYDAIPVRLSVSSSWEAFIALKVAERFVISAFIIVSCRLSFVIASLHAVCADSWPRYL